MKRNPGKFKLFRKLERLEVYLLAAENPVGKKQLRPIFRRKRSGEVLTREQVTAIKRGRKVLRREMKEQGLKRRIDFEVTATNLGLYFDRHRLLWPFFLWLIRDHTVAKVLATTAVLTTVLTITEPVIEYVIQYVTQYVTQFVTEYITEYITKYLEKDRFTISLSDDMLDKGLELSETPDFADPKEVLVCVPSWDVPCISISEIPSDVDMTDGEHHDTYFAYTFYCRYINKEAEAAAEDYMGVFDLSEYAIDYDWGLVIKNEGLYTGEEETAPTEDEWSGMETDPTEETGTTGSDGLQVSDAMWIMIIQDGEVIVCAKARDDGSVETLPTEEVLTTKKMAFVDRSVDYINTGLGNIHPALSMDTVGNLEALFEDETERAQYQQAVNTFYTQNGIKDLTQLMLRTDKWQDHYQVVAQRNSYNYYQVIPENFVSDTIVTQRTRTDVLPYIEDQPNYHKYTVVIWLEGDDPECTNELMNGHIGLNFQIKGADEDFLNEIITGTDPTEEIIEETEAA